MSRLLFLLLSLLGCNLAFAQVHRFTTFQNEIHLGFGPAVYQGDLPSNSLLTFPPKNPVVARPFNFNLITGYSHRYNRYLSWRVNAAFVQFGGNDVLDANGTKAIRNLSFRTRMFEVSPLVEFSILHWDRYGKNDRHHVFAASGLSLFYFSPQAKINGRYYKLRPLSTEGQGLPGGAQRYAPVAVSVPFIIGYRFRASKKIVAGLEVSFRKSYSDYLDDVSGRYYDNEKLKNLKGETAASLADRNLSGSPMRSGASRGNSINNDNYWYSSLIVSWLLL